MIEYTISNRMKNKKIKGCYRVNILLKDVEYNICNRMKNKKIKNCY